MTSAHDPELFNGREYIEDLRFVLPEILGKAPNQFVNAARWIVMELHNPEAFYPTSSETEIRSPEYAEAADLEDDDFAYWESRNMHNTLINGYLAGFPRLYLADGTRLDCLHYWGLNSDIFAENWAVPLSIIKGLVIYSKTRTRLQMDLEEQGMGERSIFEVPILRDTRTGDLIHRRATIDDIEKVIKDLDETEYPTQIHGINRPEVIKSVQLVDPHEASALLD